MIILLKILVEGQVEQVEQFVSHFQALENYHIFYRTYLARKKHCTEDIRLDLFVMYQKSKKERCKTIYMTDADGKEIKIELLDASQIKMNDQVWYISGKSYDIFA